MVSAASHTYRSGKTSEGKRGDGDDVVKNVSHVFGGRHREIDIQLSGFASLRPQK